MSNVLTADNTAKFLGSTEKSREFVKKGGMRIIGSGLAKKGDVNAPYIANVASVEGKGRWGEASRECPVAGFDKVWDNAGKSNSEVTKAKANSR